ncbi:hypothetical protein BOC35_25705 [Burkholderia pseudomallei]|nr:hypothetical protein BOC35_25705 [Burkholderia pseudomallei]ARL30227.1 hypothetical protein BOC48_13135 [Burkholderia pseudomallei]ARL74455.1 hypothetical protein BOC54_20440 [Burkholderia pseudomallei]ARL78637.1 hypothetical protein BOC55_04210 [Burkholderia pseudomallei]
MIMTDDEAKARIDALHDEAATTLAEQGLSPLQAYCLILEQVTVRHEPTLRLLADAAAYDQWFREQVREGLEEADDPNTKWVSDDEAQESYARKRAELLARIGKGNA